ncbi:centrosomal protein of 128 kDa-like isoform X1 [Oscarella lobularis]|uniref:centrosomal protein of 128 kDa-like isoform X1 n=1 Tax=Oscarella lobularis TaxID=121494 RepID=UPI003313C729
MSASSRLKLSELRTPRRRSRARSLLVSSRTPGNLAGELHEVADSLRDTNRRLDDTEDLFESYRDVTRRQEEMITDLESDLDRSQHELQREKRKTKRRSIVRFVDDDSSGSTDGIDKRRRSRRHAVHVASLVDRNRRARERRMESEIENLSEDLDRESELLDRSLAEKRRLAMKVDRLEDQLVQTEEEKERALSDWEDAAVNLDKSIIGNERLKDSVRDLRLKLAESNASRHKQQAQMDDLQKQFEHSRRSRHRLIDHLEKTQSHLEEAEQEREALDEELRKSENERKKVLSLLARREKHVESLEEKNERLAHMQRKLESDASAREENIRRKYAKALEAVKRYQNKVHNVKRELEENRQKMELLDRECSSLSADREALVDDVEKNKEKMRKMQQVVADLQEDSTSKSSHVQAVKHEFHKLQSKFKDALSELSGARKFAEKLKSDLLNAESQKSEIQRDKKQLMEDLRRAKENLTEEHGKLQDLESRYKRQLKLSQAKHSDLTTKLSAELARAEELREHLSEYQRVETSARSEIADLRQEAAEAQASHEALVAELRAELDRQTNERERKLDDAIRQSRDEKQQILEELSKLKATLSDKISMIEALQRQQAKDQSKQKLLQASLDKALEAKEILEQKYGKLIRAYKNKTGKKSGSRTTEELEEELISTRRTLQQITADQETVFRAVASEVDSLVSLMTADLHSSLAVAPSSTSLGMETDVRKWIADMISKLKWIEQEIRLRQERDFMLKQQVTRGHQHAQELVRASEEDRRYFLSELSKQRDLLENLSRKKNVGESDMNRQRTLRQLQEQVVQLTEHLEKSANALRASSAALKEKQKLVDELEDRQASRRARQDIMDRYTQFRSKMSDFQN